MLKKVGFSFWAEKLLVKCSSTLDKEYYMFISDYINVHNIQLSEQMNFTKFLIDIFTNKTRGRDSSDEKIELVLYGYAIEALILSIEYSLPKYLSTRIFFLYGLLRILNLSPL